MSPEDAVAALADADRLLVALDFDGTLAPLVDDPMTARMLPEARAAVDALVAAPATRVAFVSGRTLAHLRTIAEHTDDSPVLLAGSHGAEQWPPVAGDDDGDDRAERDALTDEIERLADPVEGAWVERKAFGFALHTRLAQRAAVPALQRDVDAVVAQRAPGWRRRVGHDLIEFSSRHEGKDAAVARLRAQTDATAVLFAGDDLTDEDAMRSLGAGDVGVRVGPGETAASVRVAGIPQLAELLSGLADARVAARRRA